MWLRPDVSGGPPDYGQGEVSDAALRADWVPVVSGTHPDRVVGIGAADATLWVTALSTGLRRWLPEARRNAPFRGAGSDRGRDRRGSGCW